MRPEDPYRTCKANAMLILSNLKKLLHALNLLFLFKVFSSLVLFTYPALRPLLCFINLKISCENRVLQQAPDAMCGLRGGKVNSYSYLERSFLKIRFRVG